MVDNELARLQPQSNNMMLVPKTIESALEMAKLMADAKLVPAHLRNSPGDCLLVINQAVRWGLDPLSVAQATAVVQGKLCYEGKLVSAVLVATGAIKGVPEYEFRGEGDDREIKVTATTRDGKTHSITGTVRNWKSNNQFWRTMADDMLIYRGVRQWARRYAPEAILGIVTPDEMINDPSPSTPPPPKGIKPSEVVVTAKAQPAEPAPPNTKDPDDTIDAEEVPPAPSDDEAASELGDTLKAIGEAESIEELSRIKAEMQAMWDSDIPEVAKNAWVSRKTALRNV